MNKTAIEWTETGRSIASNGYVLIWVGRDHPLADVRGYAYEHRLVASQTIGRWITPNVAFENRRYSRPSEVIDQDMPLEAEKGWNRRKGAARNLDSNKGVTQWALIRK